MVDDEEEKEQEDLLNCKLLIMMVTHKLLFQSLRNNNTNADVQSDLLFN